MRIWLLILLLCLPFVNTATASTRTAPLGIDKLPFNQLTAVGPDGWLYIRIPAEVPKESQADGSHRMKLFDADNDLFYEDVSCVLIGATFFYNTRTTRCKLPDGLKNGGRYAVISDDIPVWSGQIYTDTVPPQLEVVASILASGAVRLIIDYTDPDQLKEEQKFFPIPAEGITKPLVTVFIGRTPVHHLREPNLSHKSIFTFQVDERWPTGEISVRATDYAGNSTSVSTGISNPW